MDTSDLAKRMKDYEMRDRENMYLSPQNCRNFYPERKQ